jgi:hypothetical protein
MSVVAMHRSCLSAGQIIFEAGVFHASFVRNGMTVPRFSLDFRCTGEFQRTVANRPYVGKIFRQVGISPDDALAEEAPVSPDVARPQGRLARAFAAIAGRA